MKLCFVVNHVAFFISHRLPIAQKAIDEGYKVYLITGKAGSKSMEQSAIKTLHKNKIKHYRVSFSSSSVNPFKELYGLFQIIRIIKKIKPDVVHCASPKGNFYGGIASRVLDVRGVIFAISGMGFAFTKDKKNIKLSRNIISKIFSLFINISFSHKNKRVIVQNTLDYKELLKNKWVGKDELRVIHGSGVNLDLYKNINYKDKLKIVILPSRILIDKGVIEFVEAVKLIQDQVPGWRFLLLGAADYENPSAISNAMIDEWQKSSIIEWLGHVDQIEQFYKDASIVCLPSYREGMPKTLLEAAAAGCATITSDVIGCNEAIIHNSTGLLVPVQDSQALAKALLRLINNPEMRENFGLNGIKLAKNKFGITDIVRQNMALYKEVI